jgi:ABC-type uncharacterized transport system YnjBCD ATPase subunit
VPEALRARRANVRTQLLLRPELLLLDEPTNHLDLDATLWLEQHLTGPAWRGESCVPARALGRRASGSACTACQ